MSELKGNNKDLEETQASTYVKTYPVSKMEYTITPQYHEKKGTEIYVLRLLEKVDRDTFTELSQLAKKHKGYYSSFRGVNGFVFKTEDDAKSFVSEMSGLVGSETCNTTPSVEVEEEPVKLKKTKSRIEPRSHMSLHDALRYIVQTEGIDILKEVRLVNILDDFNAYSEMPTAKYILRAIIADGFVQKLLCIGSWNNDAINLAIRYATITGFMQDAVENVFKAIGYGLGWIAENGPSQHCQHERDNTILNNNTSSSYKKLDLFKLLRKHKFIYSKGKRFGIMNYAGEIIHDAVYNEIEEGPTHGLIQVRKGKLWGFIDSESSNVIVPKFNEVTSFHNERAIVKCKSISERKYVIDCEGNMVIPPIYDHISIFLYGLAGVVIDGGLGFIDANGEIKIPLNYPYPQTYTQTEHEILLTTEYGTKIVDKENNTLAFFDNIYFGFCGEAVNGKFIVRGYLEDGSYLCGVIDKTNKIIIPCRYEELFIIRDYENDNHFLKAKLGKKYGILSINGQLLIPFQFDDIDTRFSMNQFSVKKKNKWGTIGIDGKMILPFKYDQIVCVGGGIYYVKMGDKEGTINAQNEWISGSSSHFLIGEDYKIVDQIYDDTGSIIYLTKKGKMAYVFDNQGIELLKFECYHIVETIL